MEFRIGERDAETGLYAVIWPDGSSTLNGVKIFNAAHEVGDVVQAVSRSDGRMILDGVPALIEPYPTIPGGGGLSGVRSPSSQILAPSSYLNGQIWNEEEDLLPTVELVRLCGSQVELGSSSFWQLKRSNSRLLPELRYRFDYVFTGPATSFFYSEPGTSAPDLQILAGQTLSPIVWIYVTYPDQPPDQYPNGVIDLGFLSLSIVVTLYPTIENYRFKIDRFTTSVHTFQPSFI